jgi:transcriptional regulator with XRE-family HTH domain
MLSEEKIKEMLKDRNLTVVAREANVSYYMLGYWLREGRKPSFYLISQLSDYLTKNAKLISNEA